MNEQEFEKHFDGALLRLAQQVADGFADDNLQALAETVVEMVGASSVAILAVGGESDQLHVLADTVEVEGPHPQPAVLRDPELRRAIDLGEPLLTGGPSSASGGVGSSGVSAAFPMLTGKSAAGALVLRWSAAAPDLNPGAALHAFARHAAALLGAALRAAKALEPLRERTRKMYDDSEARRSRALERYREFIDSASDGIVVLDTRGTVLYLNRAAEVVTGYARDGLAGKAIFPLIAESHRAMLADCIERATRGEPIDTFDLDLITTSSDTITLSVASIGILSEHQAAMFAFRDVTIARDLERELRRTTEFLARILNSTVDGIIAADMKGNILLMNLGAERITGYRAAEIVGRMSVRDLYAPGVASEVMRLLRSAEHGGQGRLEAIRREIKNAGGEMVPVSISAAMVFDDAGQEIATVGSFSDLRERLHMEERLALAQKKLEITEKQAVAIELAGAAAHSLNQPLTSVMGYAQLLVRKLGPDSPHLRGIETILQEAERMAAIVRQIGSVTRYETKSYVGGAQIIDLDRSARDPDPSDPSDE